MPDAAAPQGSATGGIYIRWDSDSTRVISPSAHFRTSLGKDRATNLDVRYAADAWTSASIDVRTSASVEVSEQRDEITLGIDHLSGTTTVGVGYRLSHENDYFANGVGVSVKHEAFQKNTTFEGRISGAYDLIGRSGDDTLDKRVISGGLWLGWTQILAKRALAQLSYELRPAWGYLSSPYRFVSIGGAGGCAQGSTFCLPEVHPGFRQRHAMGARARIALSPSSSIGGAYRFYVDNWRISSHTATADFSFASLRDLLFALEYRFYTQGASFFYDARYEALPDEAFITRDRELSALNNQRVSMRVEHAVPLSDGEFSLRLAALVAGTFYRYLDFIGLERVQALELSTTIGLNF